MEVYVGTSGWMYDWNEEGTFDWYLKFSKLNAVELNASFYRFPYRNQVISWARKTSIYRIKWAVKVYRGITHFKKLSREALSTWGKFHDLFKPLDNYVDFYLFQLPPNFAMNEDNVEKIVKFAKTVNLSRKFAIEFRHKSWFNEEAVDICRKLGITFVSIDAPIGRYIATSNNTVYLRVHGVDTWYAYEYAYEELMELAEAVLALNPIKVYIFFNNNHWMLENARVMLSILTRK
ncbi:MAG: DUF72 domain-containing protein [Ignisphaera sp.]|uniref:DUF72 domain-containing protein n=1 Tax=Ignisphaera aggregans TaxID=334771 RepID=A0A7C4NPB1_9CREN